MNDTPTDVGEQINKMEVTSKMVKYKVEKKGKLYYARRYSENGFLLDSLASGTKTKAQATLKRWKKK